MRLRAHRMLAILFIVIALAILPAGGRSIGVRDARAQPPVSVQGIPPPDDRGTNLDAVDDLLPVFQEGLAEDQSQPASPMTSSTTASSGTVLAADAMTNPATGILPQSSSRPNQWKVGHANAEYQIASLASGIDLSDTVLIPGTYSDVAISVNARVIQGTATAPDQTVRIYCRRQTAGSGFTGYRFQYSSLLGLYGIFRGDGDAGATLTNVQAVVETAMPSDAHRLSLTCSGSTISASVDGVKLMSVQDGNYHSGRAGLGVGNFTRWDPSGLVPRGTAYPGTYDVRFTGLQLTQP